MQICAFRRILPNKTLGRGLRLKGKDSRVQISFSAYHISPISIVFPVRKIEFELLEELYYNRS